MTYNEAKAKAEAILAEFKEKCPKDALVLHGDHSHFLGIAHYMVDVILGKRHRINIGYELIFRAIKTGFEIVHEHTERTTVTKLWETTA